MDERKLSLEAFSEALASASPTPGGGGAGAYAASLGAALCVMAGHFTVNKKKFAEKVPEIETIMAEASDISSRLTLLVEKDAEAFEPLSKAYSIPKDDPSRDEVMESCLRGAAEVPMEVLRLSARTIELHEALLDGKVSPIIVSDVASGAVLAWSAMYASALNVRVNTSSMKDREYAKALDSEAEKLVDAHWRTAEKIYKEVYGRFV